MDLVFTTAEVVAIAVAVIIVGQVAEDGESNWLEGVQLVAVYLILGVMFYFLPELTAAVE
jgi:Ca2+:H+ antiporter